MIAYKEYLWNLFIHTIEITNYFPQSQFNTKKLLSPCDLSVVTPLSSLSLQIIPFFPLGVSEKFQSPFRFFRANLNLRLCV